MLETTLLNEASNTIKKSTKKDRLSQGVKLRSDIKSNEEDSGSEGQRR
jgi:hypothetical protein